MPGPAETTKYPYFSDGFLRVSTAKIRVFHGLAKGKSRSFFQTVWKNGLFELHCGILRVLYGLVRVFYGFQKIQLFGHHQHDESCND
jgi:hypothetical protein